MKDLTFFVAFCPLLASLQITDAAWSYASVNTQEGRIIGNGFLFRIASDNSSTVQYNISGTDVNKFRIESNTGKIFQVVPLDRETKEVYELIANAYDTFGGKTEESTILKITATDINDNLPVFKQDSLKGKIKEAHAKGDSSDPFMRVEATDKDIDYNGEITYYIVSSSDTPPSISGDRFAIDAKTGDVRLIGDLDYEQDNEVSFKVIAVDGGNVVNGGTSTAVVTVSVQDSNDMAPVIDTMHPRALSELSPLNKPLYDIYASDGDEGVNKKVYFEIVSGNIGGAFTIVSKPSAYGKSLGQLQLSKELDYEKGTKSYTLAIKAYNKEAENHADDAYSQTSTLTITVLDENEAPIFRNTPYSASLFEGPAPTKPIPVMGLQVTAEDLDFNGNQTVSYSINDPEQWFQINSHTGQIIRVGAVDREAKSVENGTYILRVVATDNYDHGQHASRIVEVGITIRDVNDNPPIPNWGSESGVQMCEKPLNSSVTIIKATDLDSAENGPKFFYRFEDSVNDNRWGFKEIDDERQEVVAKFSDYGLSSASETVPLIFTITDSGSKPQTGTSTLTVTICKCGNDDQAICNGAVTGDSNMAIIIAIIAVILLLAILIFVAVTYKRRQAAYLLKGCTIDYNDDVAQSIQFYQEEGGEQDQDDYDLNVLMRVPLLENFGQPPTPNSDEITIFIREAIGEPNSPSFDSLLVFNYEGDGSDAGSLSSIDTATSDELMDYDYLKDWGPKFKRLAEIYGGRL